MFFLGIVRSISVQSSMLAHHTVPLGLDDGDGHDCVEGQDDDDDDVGEVGDDDDDVGDDGDDDDDVGEVGNHDIPERRSLP